MCPYSYVEVERDEAMVVASAASVERDEAVVVAAVLAEGDDAGCRLTYVRVIMLIGACLVYLSARDDFSVPG